MSAWIEICLFIALNKRIQTRTLRGNPKQNVNSIIGFFSISPEVLFYLRLQTPKYTHMIKSVYEVVYSVKNLK